MRIDFKLDNTFNGYLEKMRHFGILNAYPEIKDDVNEFGNILRNAYNNTPDKNYYDYFGIPINMFFGGDYYYLNWNVTKLEEYVRDNIDLAVDVPLGQKDIFSCPSQLTSYKLKYFTQINIGVPIVLAYHFPAQRYIVIDGNHRYNAALARRDSVIKAIKLSPELHTAFMLNDLSKKLYYVHHNMHLLLNISPLKEYRISDKLDTTDYYPLTQRIIKFNRIKNIPIYLRKVKYLF